MNTTHTITSVAAREASRPGALSAWEARCSCGYVAATSVGALQAEAEGQAHVAYFAAKVKPAKRAKVRS